MNSIKYDLYTTDNAVTPVAVDITSGYQHNMLGDETTKTFYVKSYNVLGDNIDSNQDDGNALAPLLTITWDGLSAGITISIEGAPMTYSTNGGTTWSNKPESSGTSLEVGDGGPYILKEYTVDTVTRCAFSSSNTIGITGHMTASGGNITSATQMFQKLENVTSLDITNLTTSNVTDMSYMFRNSTGFSTLDLSTFDTSSVTTMSGMFQNTTLTSVDLSKFDTSNVTNMTGMFRDMDNITSLDLTPLNTTTTPTEMRYMFEGCLNLVCLSNIDTTNETGNDSMFAACPALTQPDATAQADIQDANGANWVNPNPCP